jgi:protein tyrosine/serine phosphatase
MPRVSRLLLVLVVLSTGLLFSATNPTAEPASRPATWATKLNRPGLPNLHKIDDGLYRGAQPTAEGLKELKRMGVKTIVNLRAEHSDKEILGSVDLVLEEIPMSAWNVTEDHVARFLRIATDKDRRPVFVHCQHGADRTGTMCAVYRVVAGGWTKQQAIEEMTKGGFGFHPVWTNLPKLIERLDVEKVKTKAGMKKKQGGTP